MMFKRRFFGRSIGTRKISRFATASAVSFRRRHASVVRSVGRYITRPVLGSRYKAREMDLEYGLLDGLKDNRTYDPDFPSYNVSIGLSSGSFPVARVPIRKTQ